MDLAPPLRARLAEDAVKMAIKDYKSKQEDREAMDKAAGRPSSLVVRVSSSQNDVN